MTLLRVRTIAWWVWLLGQSGVVSLYAAGIPLSGGYPTPVEATAPIGLAVAQLILGVLLAPDLLAERQTVLSSIWVGILFHAVAGRLAGVSAVESLPLVATVALWLTIAGLSSHWPSARLAMLFAVLAGPVLFYARLEYARASTSPHLWAWAWSPTVGICSTGTHPAPWPTMAVGSTLLAAHFIGRWIKSCLPERNDSADFGR